MKEQPISIYLLEFLVTTEAARDRAAYLRRRATERLPVHVDNIVILIENLVELKFGPIHIVRVWYRRLELVY